MHALYDNIVGEVIFFGGINRNGFRRGLWLRISCDRRLFRKRRLFLRRQRYSVHPPHIQRAQNSGNLLP